MAAKQTAGQDDDGSPNHNFGSAPTYTTVHLEAQTGARPGLPGNVLLDVGEGNLPKQSVVHVTQIYTMDKHDLVEKIGTLSRRRVRDILDGIQLLLEPREVDPG